MKTNSGIYKYFLLLGIFAMPVAQAADDSKENVEVIKVHAVDEFVASNDDVIILDVRTPIEYQMSHIPDAVNVDVQDETFAEMVVKLDPNKTYIVHCTKNPVGGRSGRALDAMQELGFENLYSLEGGYVEWRDEELPLIGSSE